MAPDIVCGNRCNGHRFVSTNLHPRFKFKANVLIVKLILHSLCPALFMISKTLGLSQNIAGVTFLAFGNTSADIFAGKLAHSTQSIRNLAI